MSFDQSTPPQPNPTGQVVNVATPTVKPIVTYVLLGLTVFVFILQSALKLVTGYDLLFIYGGKINQAILEGEFWRLLTPVLLHSSILHIAFNMYALFILGRRLESIHGHWRFLMLYLLSGFGGNVLSFVLSSYPSLGSSTAIFGLLAAEGVFIFQNRRLFGQRSQAMLSNVLVILFINLLIGFSPGTNIDNFGHLGGLLAGFMFASLGGPKWVVEGIPPFVSINDSRKKNEVIFAFLVVLAGFIVMAAIPFFA